MGVFKCLIRNGELDEVFLPNYLKRNRKYDKRQNIRRISLRYSIPVLKNIKSNINNPFCDFKYVRNITLHELTEQEFSNEHEILTMDEYASMSEFCRIKQMDKE